MAERITGHTELIGLIATPIRHSMSPTMHNEAFAHLGLDYVYLAFEVGNQELKDVVQGFRAMKLRGFNVSMPNKTEICQYLDKLSPAAQLVGAVNTVVNDDGVLTGHITDGTGYMRALSEAGIDIISKKMTVLGAGGAATALCVQAALDGVKAISIFNRRDKFFANAEETVAKIRHNTDCEIHLFDRLRRRLQPAQNPPAGSGREKRLPHAERPGDDAVARRARVRNLDGQTDAG